jgi:hypothetical protein
MRVSCRHRIATNRDICASTGKLDCHLVKPVFRYWREDKRMAAKQSEGDTIMQAR